MWDELERKQKMCGNTKIDIKKEAINTTCVVSPIQSAQYLFTIDPFCFHYKY